MTASSNPLVLSLFLALCSNAVLLLLLLLQLKSGDGDGNGFLKGLDISAAFNGRDSDFSADLPRRIIDRRKTQEDASRNKQVFKDEESKMENSEVRTELSDVILKFFIHQKDKKLRDYQDKNKHLSQDKSSSFHVKPSEEEYILDKVSRSHSQGIHDSNHILQNVLSTSSSVFRKIFSDKIKQKSYSHKERTKRDTYFHGDDETSTYFHDDDETPTYFHEDDETPTYFHEDDETPTYFHEDDETPTYFHEDDGTSHSSLNEDWKIDTNLHKDEERSQHALMDAVFTGFSKKQLKKLSKPINNILLPVLIKFESVILRHLDRLNNAMVSHDLRLEILENTNLNRYRHKTRAGGEKRERRGRKKKMKRGRKIGRKEREKMCRSLIASKETKMRKEIKNEIQQELQERRNCSKARQEGPAKEPQSDIGDNRTDLETVGHIVGEGLIPMDNATLQLTEEEGSGELNMNIEAETAKTTTTTTTYPTPKPMEYNRYAAIHQDVQSVVSKVNSLENFNSMVDEVLTKTRSDVIKLDDKVAEMNRKQKNLHTRATMQMYRVAELEMFMNKAEVSLHTTLDEFGRMTGRLDSFKESLTDYNTDLRSISATNQKHSQLVTELRSADSYKAHDLNEIRTSMMNLEDRVNGMYNILDQSVDTVRNDVRTMVDRICTANSKHIKC